MVGTPPLGFVGRVLSDHNLPCSWAKLCPQKEWLSWQLPDKNLIMVIRVFRLAIIVPALWAERAREKEVTRKKVSSKIQSGTGRQADKEHAVAMGNSLLFEKNCNQCSDQWHKQQQQAKDWRKNIASWLFLLFSVSGTLCLPLLCHPDP